MVAVDHDFVSELPGYAIVAFYGGAMHGAIRYVKEPVEIGHRYERMNEVWEYDGAMFVMLVSRVRPVRVEW